MALLLKVKPDAYRNACADVPAQKSKRIAESDVGQRVFVWLADATGSKSALHSLCELARFEEIEMPQVGNPERTKPGYRLILRETQQAPALPITTDDLESFRYSSDRDGLGSLGGLHRDRNDKVIELSTEQERALLARFIP